jgi:hypothetical protein
MVNGQYNLTQCILRFTHINKFSEILNRLFEYIKIFGDIKKFKNDINLYISVMNQQLKSQKINEDEEKNQKILKLIKKIIKETTIKLDVLNKIIISIN